MHAPSILADLWRRGLKVVVSGADLHISPRSALTDTDRTALRACKRELVYVLSSATVADLSPSLRELWEERAAIMEYEGDVPREQAERLALVDVLAQLHPQR